MNDFTATWLWPQWTMFVWLLLHFIIRANYHGTVRKHLSGPKKGEPVEANGFTTASRIFLLVFILICGGFFA
jgi:hypothetical protein